MWEWINSASYVAHGYCLLWEPWLVALYAGSDALIFLAYSLIPLALWQFLRLRPDLTEGYNHLVILFAAFILLCGITHLISIVTLWYPVYAFHGFAKLATATVSLMTAAVLFPLVPVIAALPTPSALKASNASLAQEVSAHEATLAELRGIQAELEARVAARTAELEKANERLTVLSREAVHRKKNLIAVIQSIARQTARTATDTTDMHERLAGRLSALAAASEVALPDMGGHVDLEAVARFQLAPQLATFGGRLSVSGPPVALPHEAAQYLALALHELATNALKHGALSTPEGTVSLRWMQDGAGNLDLAWEERGSAAGSRAESPQSFGMMLLTEAVPMQLGATVAREVGDDGFSYRLAIPAAALT